VKKGRIICQGGNSPGRLLSEDGHIARGRAQCGRKRVCGRPAEETGGSISLKEKRERYRYSLEAQRPCTRKKLGVLNGNRQKRPPGKFTPALQGGERSVDMLRKVYSQSPFESGVRKRIKALKRTPTCRDPFELGHSSSAWRGQRRGKSEAFDYRDRP